MKQADGKPRTADRSVIEDASATDSCVVCGERIGGLQLESAHYPHHETCTVELGGVCDCNLIADSWCCPECVKP